MRQLSTPRLLLTVLLCWLTRATLLAQTLDPTFQPTELKMALTTGLQQGVNTLAVQPDGKVLVAGGFDYVNGSLTGKLQRLNADGTPDATFNVGGTGANAFLSAILLQPDGKILVGGGFTTFNGQSLSMVVRLNPNGSLDPGFTFGSAASIRQISSLALQPDGKILVGSGMTLPGGTPIGGLVRLLPDGTLDPSFNIGSGITQSGLISTILVQADGNIVIGGSFRDFNGQPLRLVVRLTFSGALDPNFAFNTPNTTYNINGAVQALAQQPDGKLLMAGSFNLSATASPLRIVRLEPDGTLDNTFQPGAGPNNTVRSMKLESNGSILIAGGFTQVAGVNRGRVARLSATGSLDPIFAAGTGANNTANALAVNPTGQVLVAGGITQYDGLPFGGVVQLSATTGQPNATFTPILQPRGVITQVVPLPNGQLLVRGNFTQLNGVAAPGVSDAVRRLNADGTLDLSFSSQISGNIQALQPNGGFYLINFGPPIRRVLPSGSVDNSFTSQAFGPNTGNNSTSAVLQGAVEMPGGKLLVFGRFTTYGNLTGLNGLVRLNADGTPDNTFALASGPATRLIMQVLVQPSGKLVLVAEELPTSFATTLTRLNANGSADNTFSVGTAAGTGTNYVVFMQPDGRLLLHGKPIISTGSSTPSFLARLTADGANDPTFSTYSGPTIPYFARAMQADGRLLVTRDNDPSRAASTLVRLNLDGSLDTGFSPVATPLSIFTGDDSVTGVVVQPADGKIVLFGSFRYVAGQVRIGLARLSNIGLATRAAAAALPLVVYPNPAHDAVSVLVPAASQPRPATLSDLSGRQLRRWTVPARQTEIRLRLDAIPAGIYLLQVRGEAGVYQQQVVVTR